MTYGRMEGSFFRGARVGVMKMIQAESVSVVDRKVRARLGAFYCVGLVWASGLMPHAPVHASGPSSGGAFCRALRGKFAVSGPPQS